MLNVDEMRNPLIPEASDEYQAYYKRFLDNAMSPNTTPQTTPNSAYIQQHDGERAMVAKYSKMYGVDEYVVLGMMDAETGGGVEESRAGAKGRLQLMPGTAAQMARELGMNDYDIWDTETNLHFGIRYFAQQMKKFNDPKLAVAAYNAGPGKVDKYKGIPPFKETIRHVEKVFNRATEHKETEQAIGKYNLRYFSIGGQRVLLAPEVGERVARANEKFFQETGKHIKINSHFRSNFKQQEIYRRSKVEKFRAAKPGNSNHERGAAIDVQNWKDAEPYLRSEGLINPLSDDKVHFSITGR